MLDIIGSKEKAVAIILKGGKRQAEEIMRAHKNIKAVLKKIGGRKGEYRTYRLRLIAGISNTEVLHKEYGMLFRLDPRKVYFSPREAEERQRIAGLARSRERILIMFSGIAPYAIAIARKKKCRIICVEINKKAVEYAEQNIKINSVSDRIENVCGDIKKICERLGNFDRIVMPLPESGWRFLKYAFALAKKGTLIHFYGIGENRRLFSFTEEKIDKEAKKSATKYKIIERTKVLPFAPRMWKVRIDIKVL